MLHRKLSAVALTLLMLAGTLASASIIPPTNAQLTTLTTNLSDIQSSNDGSLYLTMRQIAERLRSTASVTRDYADVAEQNGTLKEYRDDVLANKYAFFGPVDKNAMYEAWLLARKKYSYKKNFHDFSEAALAVNQKHKQAAWNYLKTHTAHEGLIALASLYDQAADDLDARAASLKVGGTLVPASFHFSGYFYFNRMAPGDCNAADVLAGLYIISGTFFPNPVTLGMLAIGTMWYATRFYFC